MHVASLVLASALSAGAFAVDTPDFSKPRHLPSLVVRWQRPGKPCAMLVRDGVVYVLEPGRLVALDGANGSVRWEHAIGSDCPSYWQAPLLAIGETLVAAATDRLFVVDRATGAGRHTVPLGGTFDRMWGPPLVVEVGEGEARSLVAIDPPSGRVTGRRIFRKGLYDVEVMDRVALVHSASPSVVALGLPGLDQRWSAPGFSGVGLVGGRAALTRDVKEGDCTFTDVVLVDAATGRLGPRLYRRSSSDPREKPAWEFEFVEGSTFAIRRHDPKDGRLLWEASVPGEVTAFRPAGERVYAHSIRQGRGVLLTLDAASGALASAAYGLRNVFQVDASGEQVYLLTGTGVVAVAARELGPPEATTVPVREAVHGILSAQDDDWDRSDAWRDLEALGAEASPALAEELPRLDGEPLSVVVSRLAAARYKEAAPAMAQRLARSDSPASEELEIALLDALAALGGPSEVPTVKAVLDSPGRSDELKRHAFTTLVALDTPEAVDAAMRALEDRRQRRATGFTPPSGALLVALVGRPVDEVARSRAIEREDFVEWDRLGRGVGAAKAPLPDGRALVVFPDGRLGNRRDLWAQEIDAQGAVSGASVFLDARAPGPACDDDCAISASVEGDRLSVRRRGVEDVRRVSLSAARRDADGDGLADFVEGRLGTDPQRKDSDDDGIDDGLDPFPLVARREPAIEEEEVTAAVLEQFHLFGEDTAELAVLVSDRAFSASGREGPTLVVSREALDAFKAKSGLDGVAFVSIGPADAGGAPVAGSLAAFTGGEPGLPPDGDSRDRRYVLSVYRGPLNAAGYEIVVRRTGRGWLLRSVRMAWVS